MTGINILIIFLVILIIILYCKNKSEENYVQTPVEYNSDYEPGDYIAMSHLPFDNPLYRGGPDALGYIDYVEKLLEYPPREFHYAKIPVSCPPDGIRVYETGTAQNPNVQSGFGPITL